MSIVLNSKVKFIKETELHYGKIKVRQNNEGRYPLVPSL